MEWQTKLSVHTLNGVGDKEGIRGRIESKLHALALGFMIATIIVAVAGCWFLGQHFHKCNCLLLSCISLYSNTYSHTYICMYIYMI